MQSDFLLTSMSKCCLCSISTEILLQLYTTTILPWEGKCRSVAFKVHGADEWL